MPEIKTNETNSAIYLDSAATTQPCPAARAAFLRAEWYNAASMHAGGTAAEQAIRQARQAILQHMPGFDRVIFTSGATESANTVIFSAMGGVGSGNNHLRHVIVGAAEHAAVAQPLAAIAGRSANAVDITVMPPFATPDDYARNVRENTVLCALMSVNNENGFVFDLPGIYAAVKRKNPRTLFFCDHAQGFLRTDAVCDAAGISAHKIHGFKGVGALCLKKGVQLKPMMFGGGQQQNLRSGTLPTELISAFGAAAKDYHYDKEHFAALSGLLFGELSREIESGRIVPNGCESAENAGKGTYLPHIINLSVMSKPAEVTVNYLSGKGIYVSGGAACAKGDKRHSTLKVFGVPDKRTATAIRVSFCGENTPAEVLKLCEALKGFA
jgi:cysteine desulfurase